jgi:tetratricopeptide (TPR) repeat protein
MGGFQKALDYHFKRLKIFKRSEDQQDVAKIYNDLACRYQEQFFDEKALEMNEKSIALRRGFAYKSGTSRASVSLNTPFVTPTLIIAIHHQSTAENPKITFCFSSKSNLKGLCRLKNRFT